jgi:hypothetical protein
VASDRLTGPLRAIARRADPRAPYLALYRAKLVAQSADLGRVDVVPEDDDGLLPPMSNIPLRHGLPGASVQLTPGASLLVGWENGKPNRPFAALWAGPRIKGERDGNIGEGGGQVQSIILNALLIAFGGANLVPVVNGVLTGESIDPYTGMQHWMLGNGSQTVLAVK